MIKTIWPDLTEEDLAMWKDVGLTFKMIRRYQKFVLLYYVPRFSHLFALLTFKYFDIYISSLFCVVSSWGSFLISPQVLQNIKMVNISRRFQSLLVFSDCPGKNGTPRDFVSFPHRSARFHNNLLPWGIKLPSSKQHTQAMSIVSKGFWGYNGPCFLGSCPLLLHFRGNCRLHVPADLDPDGCLWWGWSEGCWKRKKSLEDW